MNDLTISLIINSLGISILEKPEPITGITRGSIPPRLAIKSQSFTKLSFILSKDEEAMPCSFNSAIATK